MSRLYVIESGRKEGAQPCKGLSAHLVEGEGLRYLRIPVQDHRWPDSEHVDEFMDLIKAEGIDNLWMHIHCHAGKGLTESYLIMYDKMKNPDIPIEQIAIRQCMLGSNYMLYTEDSDSWKVLRGEGEDVQVVRQVRRGDE